ncbi:MAG: hypothetical protein JXA22_10125 [Candidatus Thermoplasmatota archaeon]|nr:hypothetical protein [Candidatus Thermoplasmatota archaeon]
MKVKSPSLMGLVTASIMLLALTSGCIDIHSTKKVFFPSHEEETVFIQGTIAEVRHNFTGGLGDDVQVLTQEEHLSIDNFHIGKGGGDLYIYGQVHFGSDTERRVDYTRSIDVSLYRISEKDGPILISHKVYTAPEVGRFDVAEIIDQIVGAETGLWSLRVMGNGTASSTADVPFYDWFQVSVNGRFSDDSYNHDAPHSSRDQ